MYSRTLHFFFFPPTHPGPHYNSVILCRFDPTNSIPKETTSTPLFFFFFLGGGGIISPKSFRVFRETSSIPIAIVKIDCLLAFVLDPFKNHQQLESGIVHGVIYTQ